MSRGIRTIFFVIAVLLLHGVVHGQVVNTESPYSHYGLGEPATGGYVKSESLGGIAQGLRDANVVNPLNPASYTRQDTMSFILDMSFSGVFSSYRAAAVPGKRGVVGKIEHVAIQFPVGKYFGMAAGFQPYSQLGYDVVRYETDLKVLSDVGRVRYHHRGHGGVNDAFLGVSGKPFDFLSIGVNARYLFGSLNYMQDVHVPNSLLYSDVRYDSRVVVRGLGVTAGVQGYCNLGEQASRRLTLGATLDLVPLMQASNRLELRQEYVGRENIIGKNYERSNFGVRVPMKYSLGGVYEDAHWLYGVDVSYQDWSAFEWFERRQNMGVGYSVRTGVQYVPDSESLRSYMYHVRYRIGGYFSQTGVVVSGQPLYNYGVTLGMGFPFRWTKSTFQFALYLARRGTARGGGVAENHIGLTVGMSFNDIWFFKRKYD